MQYSNIIEAGSVLSLNSKDRKIGTPDRKPMTPPTPGLEFNLACDGCGDPLKKSFMTPDNPDKVLCTDCVSVAYTKGRCPECKNAVLPVNGQYIESHSKYWHKECFQCRYCRLDISKSPMVDLTGAPCCESCLMAQEGKKARASSASNNTSSISRQPPHLHINLQSPLLSDLLERAPNNSSPTISIFFNSPTPSNAARRLSCSSGITAETESIATPRCESPKAPLSLKVDMPENAFMITTSPSPSIESVSPRPHLLSKDVPARVPLSVCAKCHEMLRGISVKIATGEKFHQECFLCAACDVAFTESEYVVNNGKAYHPGCAPTVTRINVGIQCHKCHRLINGKFLRNNDQCYHPQIYHARLAIGNVQPDELRLDPLIKRTLGAQASNVTKFRLEKISQTLSQPQRVQVRVEKTGDMFMAMETMSLWRACSIERQQEIIRAILNGLVIANGCSIEIQGRHNLILYIESIDPANEFSMFGAQTHIDLKGLKGSDLGGDPEASFTPLPGLTKAYESLYEVVSYPLIYSDVIARLHVECPKGVLLFGPPGVGKTYLVSQVTAACKAKLIIINGPEVYGPYIGESEARLREKFAEATIYMKETSRPVVIFIDEIDALTPQRTEAGLHESRVVAQLLTLMDGATSRGRLVVIGATNRPNAIDPALRRPGRFDREINIEPPSEVVREEILRSLTAKMTIGKDVDIQQLARSANGYVGADLASLCRETAVCALERGMHAENKDDKFCVRMEDFIAATGKIGPSLHRGYSIDVENTSWDDVGGLDEVKLQLQQAIEWPTKYRETFTRLGLRPPRGILLYGPPGCSKTTLVKVIAGTSGFSFFSVNGAQIFSPFVGDSEKIVSDVFSRARASQPSLVFLDEIETIVGKRNLGGDSGQQGDPVQERVLSMLLNEMDGVEAATGVLIVGATNRPDMLDAALLRPGRFDQVLYVPHPDQTARAHIFRIHLKNTPIAEDVNVDDLATKTELFTGADIANVCREAALIALREDRRAAVVAAKHFQAALAVVPPSVTKDMAKQYAALQTRYADPGLHGTVELFPQMPVKLLRMCHLACTISPLELKQPGLERHIRPTGYCRDIAMLP
ncbi:hypothetical protein BZG36_01301 [Bifiguratus adelaidae]|uniref:LIM zinc-binding domain-containing protein n=1 Tax=Bifiguratus adelaidae TaxID=1938954 RepID=A0A261Y595_9FUNG|nr:hypothetical protein BZG36_01301 [Bifiguratus adelaidae]